MNTKEIIDGLEEINCSLPHSLIPDKAIELIESMQAQLLQKTQQLEASKRREMAAVKVLERIKRDINDQDKIYIHIADFFGRGIYIDEEGGCGMNTEQAIEIIECFFRESDNKCANGECDLANPMCQYDREAAFEIALSALREKAEREHPQPLTLEQLKERAGKEVKNNGF